MCDKFNEVKGELKIIKKKFNKILIILVIIQILLSFTKIINKSQADSLYDLGEIKLYSKDEMIYIQYRDIKVGTQFVVYNYNGVEYPAYCLNRELTGITMDESYNVVPDIPIEAYRGQRMWRTIINGYPYVSYTDLGCNSKEEAYVATKMAVYDILYNYNMADFHPLCPEGQRVIDAIKRIKERVNNSNEISSEPMLYLDTNAIWQLCVNDSNYIEKVYEFSVDHEFKDCEIKAFFEGKTNDNEDCKIEKIDNTKFKVKVPINKINEQKRININFHLKAKDKFIPYGSSVIANKQNYALTGDEFSNFDYDFGDNLIDNKTKLELLKIDSESYEVLEGVEFNLYDKNNECVYTNLKTNDEGKIILDNVIPGEYYIEEVRALSGYDKLNNRYKINIILNENNRVIIKNNKIKDKEIEHFDENEKVIQEEVLPRTGK